MSLNLMYITNNPSVASIAQSSGVDTIFVDMEFIGKSERQAGMNTVKCCHTFSDIENIAAVTGKGDSELLVRVNPIHDALPDYCDSETEIQTAISCGADVIMLPMFKEAREVERFLTAVDGKVKTVLLLETKEAVENLNEILAVGGFDSIHIGLNDLHLAYKRKFMFELLSDGTVERLAGILNEKNVLFGFGGIARIGYGTLPAEYIITEHYRLGSKAAILSRSFCNANTMEDMTELKDIFSEGVQNIRKFERTVQGFTACDFEENRSNVVNLVDHIIRGM